MHAEPGDMIEFIIAREAAIPALLLQPKLDPPLKSSHPTHRISVPKTALCGLCALKVLSFS